MSAALSVQYGRVIKVEMKIEDNEKVYEFDIRDVKGMDWDIECHADTGQIIETEREVSSLVSSPYSDRIKYSERESRAIALEKFPGEILELEYEIESDNRVVYEFDIRQSSGTIVKVEIDAETGEIHEENKELWQIGYE
ncbi:MAG: PepSY domain-containing protein [Thiotrichales bacterium]|nr:PepSY domain-containing protein [Thiotrichales bacterium]